MGLNYFLRLLVCLDKILIEKDVPIEEANTIIKNANDLANFLDMYYVDYINTEEDYLDSSLRYYLRACGPFNDTNFLTK